MRPGRLNPGKRKHRSFTHHHSYGFNEAGAIKPRKVANYMASKKISKASMRPGRLNPGKRTRTRTHKSGSTSFNEAGAIKPRKGLDPIDTDSAIPRFNEAGAIKPRKVANYMASKKISKASMRPGRLNPGKLPVSELVHCAVLGLQ